MKIRQGFVSNSSTTSFCIYGARVSVPEVLEDPDDEDSDYIDDYETVEKLCGENGLDYAEWDGSFIVGLKPWDMHEDETYAQFKQRVEDALLKAFNTNPDACEWIEEAGYDG